MEPDPITTKTVRGSHANFKFRWSVSLGDFRAGTDGTQLLSEKVK